MLRELRLMRPSHLNHGSECGGLGFRALLLGLVLMVVGHWLRFRVCFFCYQIKFDNNYLHNMLESGIDMSKTYNARTLMDKV